MFSAPISACRNHARAVRGLRTKRRVNHERHARTTSIPLAERPSAIAKATAEWRQWQFDQAAVGAVRPAAGQHPDVRLSGVPEVTARNEAGRRADEGAE